MSLIDKAKNARIYTGVGSRIAPGDQLQRMTKIAKWMAENGKILRSGGANGADLAFEVGCDSVGGAKEIYLPWIGFNGSPSELYNISDRAFDIASQIHPSWDRLKDSVKRLHARNIHQVLGLDLNTPSDIVICWTQGGQIIGGTRTAIICARNNGIPVMNLGKEY